MQPIEAGASDIPLGSKPPSDAPPAGGERPDSPVNDESASELAAVREAALSATFYHWVLSRL